MAQESAAAPVAVYFADKDIPSVPRSNEDTHSIAPSSPKHFQSTSHSKPESNSTLSAGFVFGSNISDRVVNADLSRGASSNLWNVVGNVDSSNKSSTVFSVLSKAVVNTTDTQAKVECETLEHSASKVSEDKKQNALNLAVVDVVTGEEGEVQIYRQYCRAYSFDTGKNKWNGLGPSHFHLNDVPSIGDTWDDKSRVVVRLTSTRRVVINTFIWNEMPVALVDSRNLRIGVFSDDWSHMRSYLFTFPVEGLASDIHDAICLRKLRAAPATTVQKPTLTNSPVPGQKRPAEDTIDEPQNKIVVAPKCNLPADVSTPSFTASQPTPTLIPQSAIFRPSVLASSSSSSLNAHGSGSLQNSSIQGTFFRQSALDNVVKRLQEHTTVDTAPSSVNVVKSPDTRLKAPTDTSRNLLSNDFDRSSFVFGENVSARVINVAVAHSEQRAPSKPDLNEISKEVSDSDVSEASENTLQSSKHIILAEMHERALASLSDLPHTLPITGEEGECVVLKMSCQFYSFDRDQHLWIGRGNAYIHLNDIPVESVRSLTSNVGPPTRSRLVARVCKTLKLLANTPIWSGLKVAMADERSVRLSTMSHFSDSFSATLDTQQTQAALDEYSSSGKPEFCAYLLVMRSPSEANRLYQALNSRLNVIIGRTAELECGPGNSDDTAFNSAETDASEVSRPNLLDE